MTTSDSHPSIPHAKPAAEAGPPRAGWHREISRDGWLTLSAAGIGWLFEVFDLFMLSLTIPAFIADFGASKATAGLVGTVEAAGLIVGGIVGGWVSDRIGRVKALTYSIGIYAVFTGLTALAPSIAWVGALRFLSGLGMGGEWSAGAALVAETWPARHRGKGGALMQIGLPLGSLLAVGAAEAVTHAVGGLDHGNWRILYAIGAVPLLLCIFLWKTVPESPTWRAGKAQKRQLGTLRGLFAPGMRLPLLIAFAFAFFIQYIYWAVFTFAPTFFVDVKHITFVNSLSFTLIQQVGSLIGFIAFAAVVDRWGRRPAFLTCLVIGAIATALFVVLTSRAALFTVSFFTGLGITGLFAGIGPWAAEMMHSSPSRGLAMGTVYNGGRVGGAIAPYIIGSLAATTFGFEIGMFTSVIAFALAFAAMIASQETRGRELTA